MQKRRGSTTSFNNWTWSPVPSWISRRLSTPHTIQLQRGGPTHFMLSPGISGAQYWKESGLLLFELCLDFGIATQTLHLGLAFSNSELQTVKEQTTIHVYLSGLLPPPIILLKYFVDKKWNSLIQCCYSRSFDRWMTRKKIPGLYWSWSLALACFHLSKWKW